MTHGQQQRRSSRGIVTLRLPGAFPQRLIQNHRGGQLPGARCRAPTAEGNVSAEGPRTLSGLGRRKSTLRPPEGDPLGSSLFPQGQRRACGGRPGRRVPTGEGTGRSRRPPPARPLPASPAPRLARSPRPAPVGRTGGRSRRRARPAPLGRPGSGSPLAGRLEARGGGARLWRLAPGKVGRGARVAAAGRARGEAVGAEETQRRRERRRLVRAATPASCRGPQPAAPELRGASPGAGPEAAKTAGRPGAGRRALCCGLRWWGTAGRGAGPGPGACGWEALWGAGARAAAGAMAEGGGGARRRAPALLEAARARYESLHISDDVFGESGPDSSGNPFYSTSAASRSSSAGSSDDEAERPGPARGPGAPAAAAQESEEDEAGAGWSATLRDRPAPRFEGTGGKARPGGGGARIPDAPRVGLRVAAVRFRKHTRLRQRAGAPPSSSWVDRMRRGRGSTGECVPSRAGSVPASRTRSHSPLGVGSELGSPS